MEKLLKLLNEFEKEKKSWYTRKNIDSYDNCVYWVDSDWETEITMYSDLYSKYYGFIKWLIDKDRINRNDIDRAELHNTHRLFEYDYWVEDINKQYYEKTLMLLAIQDNPIEFLISVLE